MFNFFKEKCPVCKMVLEKDREYPKRSGVKFCSESCLEKYRIELKSGKSGSGGGSCH